MKKKNKLDPEYVDFGEWLRELRYGKGYTEEELAEKIDRINVQAINIKKWERDLEFPDLDAIYKLSEIYMISSTEIIDKKNKTLQAGVNGANEHLIRVLSLILGISYYGALIIYRILLIGGIILTFSLFIFIRSLV